LEFIKLYRKKERGGRKRRREVERIQKTKKKLMKLLSLRHCEQERRERPR
jgi:hypothetical protein